MHFCMFILKYADNINLPSQSISVYAVRPNCILSFPPFLFADAIPCVCTSSPPLPGPAVSLYSHN